MSLDKSFLKAQVVDHLRTYKKSNNLYGIEIVYNDPEYGKTTRSIQTRGRYSWEDFEKEILEIIEKCEIISCSFLNPEP